MGNIFDKINTCRRRLKNLDNVFGDHVPRVVIFGLDGAGKTTTLYKTKLDEVVFAYVPVRGINVEMVVPKRGAKLQVYDMPGHKMARHLWPSWYNGTDAIVFVVDSSDAVRIDEAKFELHEILSSKYLRRVPLIVLANKQDEKESMNTDVVSAELDLSTINNRDWSIHATSASKGTGINRAFIDVVEKIKAFRHYKSGLLSSDDLARNNDTQKNIEDKSEEMTKAVMDNNENIPSLFATINKETVLDDENKKDDSELNDLSGNGSNSTDSNSAEYDRPTNLGEVDIDLSSNSEVSDKGNANHHTTTENTAEKANADDNDEMDVDRENMADDKSDSSHSVTEQVLVHSAETSDNNTDVDSDVLNTEPNLHERIFKQNEQTTDLDAYSTESDVESINEDSILSNVSSNPPYEFEPNTHVAMV